MCIYILDIGLDRGLVSAGVTIYCILILLFIVPFHNIFMTIVAATRDAAEQNFVVLVAMTMKLLLIQHQGQGQGQKQTTLIKKCSSVIGQEAELVEAVIKWRMVCKLKPRGKPVRSGTAYH